VQTVNRVKLTASVDKRSCVLKSTDDYSSPFPLLKINTLVKNAPSFWKAEITVPPSKKHLKLFSPLPAI